MTELHHLYRPAKIKNPPLLLLLHGYGSHENDLFSFADQLPDCFAVVSARAPLSMAWGGYCWYEINFEAADPKNRSDDEQAVKSLALIDKLIQDCQKRYETNGDVILMGFSQGAILSYALAFRQPKTITHVLALSGYLHTGILPEKVPHEQLRHLDFFITHGTEDPVIPIDWARNSVAFLEKNKINHRYHEYPIGHGIDPHAFRAIQSHLETIAKKY